MQPSNCSIIFPWFGVKITKALKLNHHLGIYEPPSSQQRSPAWIQGLINFPVGGGKNWASSQLDFHQRTSWRFFLISQTDLDTQHYGLKKGGLILKNDHFWVSMLKFWGVIISGTSTAPENWWLKDYFPFVKTHFHVLCAISGGIITEDVPKVLPV